MKITGITVGTTLPKPNFNQADPSKGDYIKNRPFYTEGGETVLIDGDFESLSVMSNNSISTGVDMIFIDGESYTLYVNGENKGTVVCASSDGGISFGSGYSSYNVLPNGNIDHFDGDGTFNIKFIQGTEEIVHQIDYKYIPNADWNASEGETGYVKNRTHYEEIAWAPIFEDKVVDCYETLFNYGGRFGSELPNDVIWENITNIRVIFDGVTYEVKNNPTRTPPTLFGNLSLFDPSLAEHDTGEPFAVEINGMLITKTGGQHTISAFYPNGTIVHQLDPKYLPIATDDEIISMLTQEDMFPVVTDADGAILSDENNNILLW